MAMPEIYFTIELADFMYGHNERYTPPIPTEENWDNTSYQKAYEVFKERFADASDFEFYFVGNVTDEQMKTLSEQYLASLPTLDRSETFKDDGSRAITGVPKKEAFKVLDDKAT